ncbi:atp-dependent rna and dna helicase [Holotrichia oblita]|uniref:Atp-dependent rna and dna helicase n=1 Tax=Holotrichia oblita TaxID=644536 RepID=A0ACB9TJS3_HOLOL|nr:atp-dependent rna and dna helicase [Holotrichia oblita]
MPKPKKTFHVEPPPILPDIEEQLREYIVCTERLPIHEYERNQEFWPRKRDITSLFEWTDSPLCSTLRISRDPLTGKILDFIEVPIKGAGANARNSMSLSRAPGPPTETVRGSNSNFPFWPGSFPDPLADLSLKEEDLTSELLTVAPGLDRGLYFKSDGVTVTDEPEVVESGFNLKNSDAIVNIIDLINQEKNMIDIWQTPTNTTKFTSEENYDTFTTTAEEEEVLPKEAPVLKITQPSHIVKKDTQWAVMLDCSKPVTDFCERIPEMAHKYKFELDTFQKQAILQLEKHNHVFVAAHTSAGKTVVAEYAIALSLKHMTRTIYTSPIKALSNQKYRDFRHTFKDVGLITGDFQINQTAGCLIMTTEILRSMLFNGSDVTRDLEFVIFDEVHYINDKERLLFATETFAMGVNMPARTVIFDSVRKHDGRELRNLLPAEYIQMAGRAGRRGSDKEGTVIILCKGKVPSSLELKDMMMGKPNQLKSQFRLTYGMVLSLLRVERLSVEGMMSRSFREADHARRMDTIREDLVKVEKNLEKECSRELSEYLQPLIKFFDRANEYLESRKQSLLSILQSHRVASELIPGRILLITHSNHINKLAMLLASNTSSAKIAYKVLILIDDRDDSGANQGEMWYKMLGLARNNVFVPVGTANHKIIMINPLDIFEITSKVIKIDPQRILADWDKRQMPRFKDSPIGESCKNAIQELLHMTISLGGENRAEIGMRYLDFIQDLKVDDALLYSKIKELNCQKELLLDHIACVQMPNFEDQFASVFRRRSLEEEKRHLMFSLSNASLSLYPDYESRINLLKELKYVDNQNQITMKGRVSCGMGMNELIITELVFKNTLRDLQPAEVAALLSCLVFQAQTKKELADFTLTAKLKEGINKIREVHSKILSLELKYQISNDLGREEELNFGLVEVVYNWASEKPFAEIMELTDVQEGIIVRCIQQLYETISDVRSGAMTVGDPELQSKMEEASRIIKRDIVFAASLYTQREAYFI